MLSHFYSVTRHLLAGMLSLCLIAPAWSDMGEKPFIPKEISAAPLAEEPGKVLAKTQLMVGTPLLVRGRTAFPVRENQTFGLDDVIHTPADARLRLKLPNGDALHIGEGSTLAVSEQADANWLVQIWEGAVTLYAAPNAQGQGRLETPFGVLAAGEGKLGVIVPGDRPGLTVYAFNNWRAWDAKEKEAQFRLNSASQDWSVDAAWKGKVGEAVSLSAGNMLRLYEEGARIDRFSPEIEVDLTFLTSPEGEALREAVVAFDKGQVEQARNRLLQIQTAFPGNAQTAYYLGAIALERGEHFETIRQWQQFIKTDPNGAATKGVPERLTLLINQEMRAEVEKALKLESTLSQAAPEPGTVAVLPFANRGDANQAILSKGLAAMMISDLSKVPNLRVLERSKLQMLADEIALSQSGLVDAQSSVRAGRMLRAEKLLIGDYKVQDDGN
ncbi:MAG: FecR domain-containing protein [Betaproteobacteria bacterium]|nr:FecR domain-containing protein [Betaproteobacteria bacterium]